MKLNSSLCAISTLLAISVTATAQLPSLSGASTLSGVPTTARFFAGVSDDEGATYTNSFPADRSVDVRAEIRVEDGHVDTLGNLYVVIHLDGAFFMRQSSGAYVPWNAELAALEPIRDTGPLSGSEAVTILDSVAFGALGISGVTLDIFFAYDTEAAGGDLFFSGQALSFDILEVQAQHTGFELYQQKISGPIVQMNCRVCHRQGGLAANTTLVYADSSVQGYQQQNYNTLLSTIRARGAALVKSKPQGGDGHQGGVRLQPGSAALADWIEYVDRAAAE